MSKEKSITPTQVERINELVRLRKDPLLIRHRDCFIAETAGCENLNGLNIRQASRLIGELEMLGVLRTDSKIRKKISRVFEELMRKTDEPMDITGEQALDAVLTENETRVAFLAGKVGNLWSVFRVAAKLAEGAYFENP